MTAIEQLTLDPLEEGAGNDPLELVGGAYAVAAFATPTPTIDPRWAQPADADGDRLVAARYQNREIAVSLTITPGSGASAPVDAQAALARLAAKLAKVNREGGTLRRVLPSGDALTFDLLTTEAIDPPWDAAWDAASATGLELRFVARPFARGEQQVRTSHAEAARPVLVFTESAVPGDVPALGRLQVSDGAGIDRAWCAWAAQIETYDPAASAGLFYEAESRTPLGSARVGTATGASGGASNNAVIRSDVGLAWTGVLSTRAAGGGAHLTHVGDYRVFARIQPGAANTGALSVRLEWALGDFGAYARNATVTYEAGELTGEFAIADLGIVSIPGGTPHWEGRIVAGSTVAADDLSVDCLWLMPTERSGEAFRVTQTPTIAAVTARDAFDYGSAVALNGCRTVPGGTWSSGGDADDFTIDTSAHAAKRTATGDVYTSTRIGRWAVLPPVKTDTVVQADIKFSAVPVDWNSTEMGVVARFADSNNYIYAIVDPTSIYTGEASAFRVGVLQSGFHSYLGIKYLFPQLATGAYYTLRLEVDARGNWKAWFGSQNALPALPTLSGQSSALATGGALASGKDGIWEWWYTTTAATRYYDNFSAWVPTPDAAVFANRGVAFDHERVERQDPDGTLWTPVSRYEGDLLTIPPAGAQGRIARFAVATSRNVPGESADSAIDAVTAQLSITPRYLVVP